MPSYWTLIFLHLVRCSTVCVFCFLHITSEKNKNIISSLCISNPDRCLKASELCIISCLFSYFSIFTFPFHQMILFFVCFFVFYTFCSPHQQPEFWCFYLSHPIFIFLIYLPFHHPPPIHTTRFNKIGAMFVCLCSGVIFQNIAS